MYLTRNVGLSVLTCSILSATASLLPLMVESQFVGTCTSHLFFSHTGRSSRCPRWSVMNLSIFLRMVPHNKQFVSCPGAHCKVGYLSTPYTAIKKNHRFESHPSQRSAKLQVRYYVYAHCSKLYITNEKIMQENRTHTKHEAPSPGSVRRQADVTGYMLYLARPKTSEIVNRQQLAGS